MESNSFKSLLETGVCVFASAVVLEKNRATRQCVCVVCHGVGVGV